MGTSNPFSLPSLLVDDASLTLSFVSRSNSTDTAEKNTHNSHGFDVYGSADTKYLSAQAKDRAKRDAIGNYVNSGLSGYQVAGSSLPDNTTYVVGDQGINFPVQWAPRYTIAAGGVAHPDMRECVARFCATFHLVAVN